MVNIGLIVVQFFTVSTISQLRLMYYLICLRLHVNVHIGICLYTAPFKVSLIPSSRELRIAPREDNTLVSRDKTFVSRKENLISRDL